MEWKRERYQDSMARFGGDYGVRKAKNSMLGTKILSGFEHCALVSKPSSAGSRELKASKQVGT